MAGVSAAIAASQEGAKTLLVDCSAVPGGLATAAMVGTFCGLFARHQTQTQWAFKGQARALAEKAASVSGSETASWKNGLRFLPYDPQALSNLLKQEICENHIHYLPRAQVKGICMAAGGVSEVHAQIDGATSTIRPACVIDASGHALSHELAGLPTMPAIAHQAAALAFSLEGLPTDMDTLPLQIMTGIHRGVQAGKLSAEARRITITPGSLNKGAGLFKFGIPPPSPATDLGSLKAVTERVIDDVLIYLRREEPLLRSIALRETAPEIGIRTGSRPVGQVLLTDHAVRNGLKPEDGIAAGVWPIEFWDTAERPDMEYFEEEDYYLIPAGSLVSACANNLFFAGRNLYAEDRAHASARVIGTCMQMGLASGILAASQLHGTDMPSAIATIRERQLL